MQEELKHQPETILPYDMVSLPSQGVFYKNKKKSVKVTYLNASDENLLASAATQKGDLVNLLIQRKLVDKDIKAEEMADCDKEAILIFLRNTAFGPEYTVTLKDPKTEKNFDITIDLSILKTKDIEVKLDENNEFEFLLEKSNKKVKLCFLSPTAQKELKEIDEQNKDNLYNPFMTKQLEKMIKEIDGNRDPMTIAQYIQTMPIADSHAIKKVVRDNTPSLDLTVKSKTPSGDEINVLIAFGVEFFRPFYGI
tara:strand:- start:9 stop:764 length:756 start_codon:yes stop_codon:yes gene_type:complete